MARILLLEDDVRFARAAARALRSHEVIHVTEVADAKEQLQAETFGCVLIDWDLTNEGDASGIQLVDYMQRRFSDIPRAVVTGSRYLEGAILHNLIFRYQVEDVVLKGTRAGGVPADLDDVVERMLDSKESSTRKYAATAISNDIDAAISILQARHTALRAAGAGLRISKAGDRASSFTDRIAALESVRVQVLARIDEADPSELGSMVLAALEDIKRVADVS